MPAVDGTGQNYDLPSQFAFAKPYVSTGVLRFNEAWWSMRFVDDVPVGVDLCDKFGHRLPDVPATPEAVRTWLEAEQPRRALSWIVPEAESVPVDGRMALRWDLLESPRDLHCRIRVPAGQPWTEMLVRIYAIPTGDDTILLIGGSDMVNFEAVADVMDGIVRTMDFQ
jgi:hypothetical protein